MKSLILTSILFCCTVVRAQIVVGSDYNGSTYGTNLGISVGKQFESHFISLGLRINDAKSSTEPLENINVHPTNLKESLGFKINYKYFIKTNLAVKPFVMFASEYTHCPIRADYLSELSSDSIINPNYNFQYYIGAVRLTDPYHIFDGRIGIGFTADITERFFFALYGGSGLTWMKYDEGDLYVALPGPAVNNFFGIGFSYRIQ